jgi:hypothetical protein
MGAALAAGNKQRRLAFFRSSDHPQPVRIKICAKPLDQPTEAPDRRPVP